MRYTDMIMLDTSEAGRDLDYACIRACPSLDEYAPSYNDDHWNRRYWYGSVPRYSTDYDAARLLEDEIERQGLQEAYINALNTLLGWQREPSWDFLRATPEQRARAFLQVVA